jgi:hypothetical protein
VLTAVRAVLPVDPPVTRHGFADEGVAGGQAGQGGKRQQSGQGQPGRAPCGGGVGGHGGRALLPSREACGCGGTACVCERSPSILRWRLAEGAAAAAATPSCSRRRQLPSAVQAGVARREAFPSSLRSPRGRSCRPGIRKARGPRGGPGDRSSRLLQASLLSSPGLKRAFKSPIEEAYRRSGAGCGGVFCDQSSQLPSQPQVRQVMPKFPMGNLIYTGAAGCHRPEEARLEEGTHFFSSRTRYRGRQAAGGLFECLRSERISPMQKR